jgi:hypothetical protein
MRNAYRSESPTTDAALRRRIALRLEVGGNIITTNDAAAPGRSVQCQTAHKIFRHTDYHQHPALPCNWPSDTRRKDLSYVAVNPGVPDNERKGGLRRQIRRSDIIENEVNEERTHANMMPARYCGGAKMRTKRSGTNITPTVAAMP